MILLPLLLSVSPVAQGPTSPHIGGLGAPLHESDASRVIPAGLGTTVVILLPNNAGTGYRWRLLKAVNVTPAGPISTSADPATASGDVGRPLVSRALFRVDHPGRAEVVLELDPPGRGRAPAKVLRYRFAVK